MKVPFNMKKNLAGIIGVLALLFVSDIAEAQYGAAVARTTRRRTAVVVASATHAKDEQAAAEQQAAADQAAADQKAADQAEADKKAAEQAEAAKAPAAQGDHLPYSTVVNKLPEGCETVVVSDVQYYHCGNDYYRAAYQDSNLVYITTEAPV